MTGFVDTNVVIYHLAKNHPEYSPRCSAFLEQLSLGNSRAISSITVVFEAIYVLGTTFRLPSVDIAPGLAAIVKIEAIHFDHRQSILDALDFWAVQGPLSFADCYHLALTKNLGLDVIYTFDTKMNRYPGVERVEPA